MAVIEIDNLSKSYRVYQKREGLWASIRGLFRRQYRDVHAVRNVSLRVEKGEFVAFLGPNGAGKSTTMKLLTGYLAASEGTAKIAGHNMATVPDPSGAAGLGTDLPGATVAGDRRGCARRSVQAVTLTQPETLICTRSPYGPF